MGLTSWSMITVIFFFCNKGENDTIRRIDSVVYIKSIALLGTLLKNLQVKKKDKIASLFSFSKTLRKPFRNLV